MPALPAVPANRYDEARRAIDRMVTHHSHSETRILVQAAAAACEDKKPEDTRILELDPADSGLSDFFLVTSATNERQALAIADEIEMRLKRNHGVTPNSVEGRRHGEWILLDYVDFVVPSSSPSVAPFTTSSGCVSPRARSRPPNSKPTSSICSPTKPARRERNPSRNPQRPPTR